MLRGWNRDCEIVDNEFSWIGESAIVNLGESDQNDGVKNVNQPRRTIISRNLVREVGIFGKQTAGCE
jgi:hypothetical protein|tara:strand:+ start:498 stop:698 length:201 start_codon:yes stop_codon:yes gene_type:complete